MTSNVRLYKYITSFSHCELGRFVVFAMDDHSQSRMLRHPLGLLLPRRDETGRPLEAALTIPSSLPVWEQERP